jgi:hypothetical protein
MSMENKHITYIVTGSVSALTATAVGQMLLSDPVLVTPALETRVVVAIVMKSDEPLPRDRVAPYSLDEEAPVAGTGDDSDDFVDSGDGDDDGDDDLDADVEALAEAELGTEDALDSLEETALPTALGYAYDRSEGHPDSHYDLGYVLDSLKKWCGIYVNTLREDLRPTEDLENYFRKLSFHEFSLYSDLLIKSMEIEKNKQEGTVDANDQYLEPELRRLIQEYYNEGVRLFDDLMQMYGDNDTFNLRIRQAKRRFIDAFTKRKDRNNMWELPKSFFPTELRSDGTELSDFDPRDFVIDPENTLDK